MSSTAPTDACPGVWRLGPALSLLLLCAACTTAEPRPPIDAELAALRGELEAVSTALSETRAEIASRDAAAGTGAAALAEQVAGLDTRIDALPATLAALCPAAPPTNTAECKREVEIRTIKVGSDKLVVGEVERIVLDPPGGTVVARIDTGAMSSSLHAEGLVEFERDGKRWVRFTVQLDDGPATLERPIRRIARVRQEDDPQGNKRPVVQLRVRLGSVSETIDFTLADRSHMDNEILLGRNFLTDVALVDVGQRFLQPPPKRSENTTGTKPGGPSNRSADRPSGTAPADPATGQDTSTRQER
jgi:hypothetical protein